MRPRKKQWFDALQTDVPADVEDAGPSKKYFFQLHPKLNVASKVHLSRVAVSNSSISNFKPRSAYVQSKVAMVPQSVPQSVPPSQINLEVVLSSRECYNYENIGYKMQTHKPFESVVRKSFHDEEDKPDLSGVRSNDHHEPEQVTQKLSPYIKESNLKQFLFGSTINLGNSNKQISLRQILNNSLGPKRPNTIPLKELHEYERASSIQNSGFSKEDSQGDHSSMQSRVLKSALKGSRAGESVFKSAQTEAFKKSVNFSQNTLILKYQITPKDNNSKNSTYQRIK